MTGIALYLLFVAIAVYVQSLTGFALALVLLGLVGAIDLYPLNDVVNVLSIISLINAGVFLHRRGALRLDPLLRPALGASLLGTVVGVLALSWVLGSAYQVLRLLLGLSIVGCAALLWRAARPLPAPSSTAAFVSVGFVSGLMGGLFSTAGPPLVYQFYRQPWSTERIQASLVYLFGAGALVRLLVVLSTGGFSRQSAGLALIAVPVVVLVTTWSARRPPPLSPAMLKRLVCVLLVATGGSMVADALRLMAAR